MLFGIGFLLVILGVATVLRSPLIGGMIIGLGFLVCHFGGDESAERLIGILGFLAVLGMIAGFFAGSGATAPPAR